MQGGEEARGPSLRPQLPTFVPLGTKALMGLLVAFYIASWLWFPSPIALANCPVLIAARFQFHKLLLAPFFQPFLIALLLDLLFLFLFLSTYERTQGTIPTLHQVLLLAVLTNTVYMVLVLGLSNNPLLPLDSFTHECTNGFFTTLFCLFTVSCLTSPDPSRSCLGLFDIPTKWFPVFLAVLFWIISPKSSLLIMACSIFVGFLYAYGWLDVFKLSEEHILRLETSSFLRWFTRLRGMVPLNEAGEALPGPAGTEERRSFLVHQGDAGPRAPPASTTFSGGSHRLGSGPPLTPPPPVLSAPPVTQEPHPTYAQLDSAAPNEASVRRLVEMGFSRHDALHALTTCEGDVTRATEFLSGR